MFRTRFWGVRGTIACPNFNFLKFGGNTSCVTIECDSDLLIFDAGTGIRSLGNQMIKEKKNEASLFFSHTHWDHINGFPFFKPAYINGVKLDIFCGNLKAHNTEIFEVLSSQMQNPTFPVPIDVMEASMNYKDFDAGVSFQLKENIQIVTAPLNHPKGATGYRVNYNNFSVCYVTDTEHHIGERDQNILKLIENSDLVIYDSTYTDEEYPKYKGWGHSTWQEGVRLCTEANVKKFAIFHHDPSHDDEIMTKIKKQAKEMWDGTFIATEGVEVNLKYNLMGNRVLEFSRFNSAC